MDNKHQAVFRISSAELKEALAVKAKLDQDVADTLGRIHEGAMRELYNGEGTTSGGYALLVKEACLVLEETFVEEGIPRIDDFVKIIQRHRDVHLMKARSLSFLASHVTEGRSYDMTSEELEYHGLIEWPDRLPYTRICSRRFEKAEEVEFRGPRIGE